ncbi:MAG: class I tRNA ligase family protein, partial [Candidatus Caldipriscus sp.]
EMMSKSRGNVVPLGPFVDNYGADAARVAILFAAPPDMDFEWTDAIVTSAIRFLNRIWRVFYSLYEGGIRGEVEPDFSDKEFLANFNDLISGIRKDYEKFKFNTAIAKLMEALNLFEDSKISDKTKGWFANIFIRLLAPIAPHIAEELFHQFKLDEIFGTESVFRSPLPEPLEGISRDLVEIGVQINGKFRGTIMVPSSADEGEVLEAIKRDEKLSRYITGEVKKVIYVRGRVVNIVL